MSKHSEEVKSLLDSGFDQQDATEIADQRALNKIIHDEDEQYIEDEEIEEESDGEVDDSTDDTVEDFEYDEDEQEELSFEDGFKFLDDEDDE